jgi:hypothetical protein
MSTESRRLIPELTLCQTDSQRDRYLVIHIDEFLKEVSLKDLYLVDTNEYPFKESPIVFRVILIDIISTLNLLEEHINKQIIKAKL